MAESACGLARPEQVRILPAMLLPTAWHRTRYNILSSIIQGVHSHV